MLEKKTGISDSFFLFQGICQVCPVIGPKKSYPTLTFDNLGRPNGKNELQPKSKESRIQSKTSRRKEPTSGNGTELDDDVNAHWWREKRPLPPEKKDYDHEGNTLRINASDGETDLRTERRKEGGEPKAGTGKRKLEERIHLY